MPLQPSESAKPLKATAPGQPRTAKSEPLHALTSPLVTADPKLKLMPTPQPPPSDPAMELSPVWLKRNEFEVI